MPFPSAYTSNYGEQQYHRTKHQTDRHQQKEMALQQQYALEQMTKSAEFQLSHDKQMFDYQNAYNDPKAASFNSLSIE